MRVRSNARYRDRISDDLRVSMTAASLNIIAFNMAMLYCHLFLPAVAASGRITFGAASRVSGSSLRALEIRFRRSRDIGVRFVILLDVFRADDFRPVVSAAPIGDGPAPRCREHALILDREMDLEVFAGRSRRPRRAP